MNSADSRLSRRWALWLGLAALLSLRLPSFVEPVGNDQNLYLYIGDRVLAGEVPYVDAWDHKPPGIYFLYGALRSVWPHPSAVALADTLAAGLAAWGLVILGRRAVSAGTGFFASAVFLVLTHPSLARLSGVYIRGQCEVFIACAVTLGLVIAWRGDRTAPRLLAVGMCLGSAVWLKYNAVAYALPILAALYVERPDDNDPRPLWLELAWVATGLAIVSFVVLAYFASHRALEPLRMATIDYNLRYSGDTYSGGPVAGLSHVASMIVGAQGGRARADLLWYLGGVGAVLMAMSSRHRPALAVVWCWLAAAIVSIAVNGARDLPQYFVQAGPVLALAAAAGLIVAVQTGVAGTIVAGAFVLLGLWKVGVDTPEIARMRLGNMPELVRNIATDVAFIRGRIDRRAYLNRFVGAQKFPTTAVADLIDHVRATTNAADRILVFGFSPAVYVETGRRSASKFFWSRPVIYGFASDRPGYGPAGLLADLQTSVPTLVTLQKQDWAPDVANSADYFMHTPALRDWLTTNYDLEQDTQYFTTWRKKPA
jgi:hypothetical protein